MFLFGWRQGSSTFCLQCVKLRGFGGSAPKAAAILRREKSQLAHRISPPLVQEILALFNSGQMDCATALERLHIGRTQLYRLRTAWLKDRQGFVPKTSGGNHKHLWPQPVEKFLQQIIPLSQPLNYAFIADQLSHRFDFNRSRSAVAQHIQQHYPQLISQSAPGPKPRRRWESAAIGELFQHDSSPHQWWPGDGLQNLILTADDHSRKILAGRFDADTTWSHFCLLRPCFETHGCPAAFYTDGLSLFGHTSSADRLDTASQFQRALSALGVNHRVAPSPQAKGKIERLFGTLQKRLVTLFAYEKVQTLDQANQLLATEIARYNRLHQHRTTGLTPEQAWDKALSQQRSKLRPAPHPKLLDLHFALHIPRRVSSASTIEFLGKTWNITPTPRSNVLLIHHPQKHFWIVIPTKPLTVWPDILGSYSL